MNFTKCKMRRSRVPGIGPLYKSPIPGTDPMQALFLNLPTYRLLSLSTPHLTLTHTYHLYLQKELR